MQKNTVKEKMRQGRAVVGPVCNIVSPQLTEIFALAEFDFIIFDMEHSAMSFETLEGLVRAAKIYNMVPFARVPENNPKTILRALDTGCLGVMIPQVETREEARLAVASTKYPTQGIRGTNWKTVASAWGNCKPKDYIKEANENIMTIIQIETEKAVSNLEEIVQVEGIDVMMLGTSDLSTSMGHYGDVSHEEVQKAVCKVLETGKRVGIPVGAAAETDKEKMIKAQKDGVLMFFVNPAVFIRKTSEDLVEKIKETFIS